MSRKKGNQRVKRKPGLMICKPRMKILKRLTKMKFQTVPETLTTNKLRASKQTTSTASHPEKVGKQPMITRLLTTGNGDINAETNTENVDETN